MMNMKCGCRVPLSWPFLISVCEHGNPLQKDKSEVAKERKKEKEKQQNKEAWGTALL